MSDRFVRGDKSRNTEGSGLGLAIVKSFVELQGGKFHIEVDGDLFKAIISFKKK
ncbi:ATP-binding protein [Clostridium perfringens]|nr:ATP-binding protein [Clostridium perfringens]